MREASTTRCSLSPGSLLTSTAAPLAAPRFGLDGTGYEIGLNAGHTQQPRDGLVS
jgi:hypothetical protein